MSKTLKKEEKVEYTGRYLVLLPEGSNTSDSINQINSISGLNLKSSLEFENEFFTDKDLAKTDGIILDKLGIAIVNEKPKIENSISSLGESEMIVEKERVVYAIGMLDESTQNYVEGYRDAVNQMTNVLVGTETEDYNYEEQESEVESVGATWGLKATNVVPTSFLRYNPYNGAGIKVAILDTGFDFHHPDFAGRPVVHQSFISGESTQDGHGHGTHCTGTACGPSSSPSATERYGIAYAASIYIGKVLSNGGSGGDGGILAGINWAIANRCDVVSMSLRGFVTGAGYSAVFETAAARALAQGTLIIAAAGNDSARPGTVRQVMHPANCPSIMAVGAVDVNMNVAAFSNGGLYPTYGAVDIAAPGVNVYSSTKLPTKYASWNGTSMATPHVAGIAALWAQASGLRGINLWRKLTSTAKALPLPGRDVGAGLVQAPTKTRLIKYPIDRFPIDRFPIDKLPILVNPKFPIDPIGPIEKIIR
ncbi:S8 family peptidase [Pedobacter ginsenosidimutans]|uniref:S8 family peptidase n=1 Tax=Pedobacter ginsenosidimutans TaxID=687842 RepID=UPI0009F8BF5B|nr:S8 family serine peptidase [Pedobacter ginsenosidimutans]